MVLPQPDGPRMVVIVPLVIAPENGFRIGIGPVDLPDLDLIRISDLERGRSIEKFSHVMSTPFSDIILD